MKKTTEKAPTEESQSTLNSNNDATNEAKSEQPSTEETTK